LALKLEKHSVSALVLRQRAEVCSKALHIDLITIEALTEALLDFERGQVLLQERRFCKTFEKQ